MKARRSIKEEEKNRLSNVLADQLIRDRVRMSERVGDEKEGGEVGLT